MINLAILAEQQKIQETIDFKIKISEQTHDKRLAGSFEPITKKLKEMDDSTRELGEVFKKSYSEIETCLLPALEKKTTRYRKNSKCFKWRSSIWTTLELTKGRMKEVILF